MSGAPDIEIARRLPAPSAAPTKHDKMLVLERLIADEDYRHLSGTDQHVLAVAVQTWMNSEGYWWPKRKTWAAEAKVCTKTITRATDNFVAVGLITKQQYRRPPNGYNGAAIYRLAPKILTGRDTESPPVAAEVGASHRQGHGVPARRAHRQGQGVPAGSRAGSKPPRVRVRPGGGAARVGHGRDNGHAPAVRIVDNCPVHGRSEHVDDGENVPRCVDCSKAEAPA
jgi:hypothetical protein